MMNFAKEIGERILSREPFPLPRISVYDILEHYGMETYHSICCDRIADEWDIDGEHIEINFILIGDLILDYIGIMICDDILAGYIGEDNVQQLVEFFREKTHSTKDRNKMLEIMKDVDIKELRRLVKCPEKYFDKLSEEMLYLMKSEIKARRIWNRAYRKIRKAVHNIYFQIKYWRIFSLMKQFAREMKAEETEN